MKAADVPAQSWSRRQWTLSIALALAAQAALIFWLSGPPVGRPQRRSYQTGVRLIPDPAAARLRSSPEQIDPTLFALVTTDGFSGQAWLTIPPLSYGMTNPPEPLHWLDVTPEDLAADFSEFVQTNLISEDLVLNELPAALVPPVVPGPTVVPGTVLKLEGGLANYKWRSDSPVPQLAEAIVTNTTLIRILVDATGRTVSAALLSPSGAPAADQSALSFARTVRFPDLATGPVTNKVSPSGIVAGTLDFQWSRIEWAQPPPATAQR